MYRHLWSKVTVVEEGEEPLPCCNFFRMYMPVGRIIKHQRTALCDKNSQIRWQRRDVAIADRCSEATFGLIEEDQADCIEGVQVFKYLKWLLYRPDNK